MDVGKGPFEEDREWGRIGSRRCRTVAKGWGLDLR